MSTNNPLQTGFLKILLTGKMSPKSKVTNQCILNRLPFPLVFHIFFILAIDNTARNNNNYLFYIIGYST